MVKKINPVFYEEFRSITLVLDSRTNSSDLSIPITTLLDWIKRYDSWWTKATGISKGKNLHLLYGRYISCIGSRILRFIPDLLDIASLSSSIGFVFLLQVDLNESLEKKKIFHQIINSGNVGGVSIGLKKGRKYRTAEYLSLIEMIIRKGISVNLWGPPNFWKEIGALDSPILNSSSFRMTPSSIKKVEDSSDGSQIALIESKVRKYDAKSNFVIYPFSPCSERFQINISPNGDIYPCKGLIGIPGCRMGTINDRIEDTVFGGGKNSFLDFTNLARRGPKLQVDDTVTNFKGLAPICFFHRNFILEGKV